MAKVIEPLLKIGRYGFHVLRCPSGRYSYFGTIPAVLCDGGRIPSFDTEAEALAFARGRGVI